MVLSLVPTTRVEVSYHIQFSSHGFNYILCGCIKMVILLVDSKMQELFMEV